MRDILIEILGSIKRNKLRTCLTGFAVAWGIFMLIVLLGAGNGLKNALSYNMDGYATNVIQIGGGRTSKPYDGLQEGRRIRLEDKDIDVTASDMFSENVDEVSAILNQSTDNIVYGTKSLSSYVSLMGVYPLYFQMNKMDILAGRAINENDLKESRKTVLISSAAVEALTDGSENYSGMIGKRLKINGLMYKVVGVYKADASDISSSFYMPFTTMKTIFARGKEVDNIAFTFHGLTTEEENEAFEKTYRGVLNRRHRAAPDDTRAIWIDNWFTQDMQLNKAMHIITVALWIVGLFTLLSGIVGVSNIMLITVKERTHEFGIRKAIGARPGGIVKLIIFESVAITAFFGYVGMVLGMLACQIMDKTLGSSQVSILEMQATVFVNPTVGLDVAIEATLVLIIAGTLAGLVPAVKASRVRPIEALRAD